MAYLPPLAGDDHRCQDEGHEGGPGVTPACEQRCYSGPVRSRRRGSSTRRTAACLESFSRQRQSVLVPLQNTKGRPMRGCYETLEVS